LLRELRRHSRKARRQSSASTPDELYVIGQRLEETTPQELAALGNRLEVIDADELKLGGFNDASQASANAGARPLRCAEERRFDYMNCHCKARAARTSCGSLTAFVPRTACTTRPRRSDTIPASP
jgi:hypothetical protein